MRADGRSGSDARQVWIALCDLVFENVRRREAAEAAGVSFGKVRALRRLLGGPVTMGALAASLGIDAPNAAALVGELESGDLVVRRADPGDRRTRLVELTAAGRERAENAQAVLAEPPSKIAALDPRQLEALATLLQALENQG